MNCILELVRYKYGHRSTMGKLYLNGDFIGYTLELPWKENKVRVSCIPKGVYDVKRRQANESKSFKYEHLHVQNVPGRTWILFHVGNWPKDILGCIAVGELKREDSVIHSRRAFSELMVEVRRYKEVQLVIRDKEELE